MSGEATMARAIFAECIVSPQRDHKGPEVKCLPAPFKVNQPFSLCKTVIIDLLDNSDDRLRLSQEL